MSDASQRLRVVEGLAQPVQSDHVVYGFDAALYLMVQLEDDIPLTGEEATLTFHFSVEDQ